MVEIRYGGAAYDCAPSETVLEALLRQGKEVPFSCRKGVCLTCMLRAVYGRLPADAQEGLKDTLRLQAYFLPCICKPGGDLKIAPPRIWRYLAAPRWRRWSDSADRSAASSSIRRHRFFAMPDSLSTCGAATA